MYLANLRSVTCSQRVSLILGRASVTCCTQINGDTRHTACCRRFISGHRNPTRGRNKWQITRLGINRFASAHELERPIAVSRLSTIGMSDTTSDQAGQGKLTVQHDPTNREFFIMLGKAKAYLLYKELGDGKVDLYHTLVPPEFRGRGVAKILAQAALDHFAAQSTPMVLTCTYLQKFVKDNPQPQHIQFIVDR